MSNTARALKIKRTASLTIYAVKRNGFSAEKGRISLGSEFGLTKQDYPLKAAVIPDLIGNPGFRVCGT